MLAIGARTMQISELNLNSRVVLLAAQLVPLLGFASGLWRGNCRSCVWLCFVLLFYFTAGVGLAAGSDAALTVYVELVLVVTLFATALMFARWRAREILGDRNGQ